METIDKTVKYHENSKFVCDYFPHDFSKKYTINGINRAIVLFENNLDRLVNKTERIFRDAFYHSLRIPHEHLLTPYEVRK